jgi:hypothetical protein
MACGNGDGPSSGGAAVIFLRCSGVSSIRGGIGEWVFLFFFPFMALQSY